MKNITIKFFVEYSFDYNYIEMFKATIRVILPADQTNRVIPELYDHQTYICNEILHPNWGFTHPEGRWGRIDIYGYNWSDVKEKVEKTRKEIISKLKDVYERNTTTPYNKPRDETFNAALIFKSMNSDRFP